MSANFNMIDCWAILCDKPKWIARVNKLENKGNKATSVEEPTTAGSRPLGCKSSKQQEKRKTMADDRIEGLQKRLKMIQEEKEKDRMLLKEILEHDKKVLEASNIARDFEIMSKDLSPFIDNPKIYNYLKEAQESAMMRYSQRLEDDAKPKEVVIVEDEEPREDVVEEVVEEVRMIEGVTVQEVEVVNNDIKLNK